MKTPTMPPEIKERHHHLWSSAASWKYVNAITMKLVTTVRRVKARKRTP
jgi:hypothetical protein